MRTKKYCKSKAKEAIERQEWRVYIRPPEPAINISLTLIPQVEALMEAEGQEADMLTAMSVVAGQHCVDYRSLAQGDPLQQEVLFRLPQLRAIHFLGMDGQIWASDSKFFPYE